MIRSLGILALLGSLVFGLPQPASVSPMSAIGSAVTYSFNYVPDSSSQSSLQTFYAITDVDLLGKCVFAVISPSALYVMNDAGTVWLPAVALGSSQENSYCRVGGGSLAATPGVSGGVTLTVTVTYKVPPMTTGNKRVYLAVTDVAGQASGWRDMNAILCVGSCSTSSTPAPGAVSPANGIATDQIFSFTFSDADGYADISAVQVIFNQSLNGANACHFTYHRALGTVYLVANDGLNVAGSGQLGAGGGALSNSQCTVYPGTATVTVLSATQIRLNIRVVFNPQSAAMAAQLTIYRGVQDFQGQNSGWVWDSANVWWYPQWAMLYSASPEAIGGSGNCVLTANPPVYTIQRAHGNQINVSARMVVNGPVQGNWQVKVQLFVYFSGQSFGHGIPDTNVTFTPATTVGTEYGPIGSVTLEPRGSGEYWLRAVTYGVCNNTTTNYGVVIGDSFHFPVQRPTVFVPDSNGNPTGLTSADFWYLGGAPSTDGYYTQYRLAMNPNTTPGQGTYSYSWLTNDTSRLDLNPESPATRVIIVSKGSSSPGYPSGEITVKASLNGFTSLAFQVRINTPHRLSLVNTVPFNEKCQVIFGSVGYIGYQSGYFYNILDIGGAVLNPIVTHETLENRRVVRPNGDPANWATNVDRSTWVPGNADHWGQVNNSWGFIDNYRICNGPGLPELDPPPFDPTPTAPTGSVVNFTQKFWVGTPTPETTNTFTGKCVQRNIALLKQSFGSVESITSPATPAQCAAGAFVN